MTNQDPTMPAEALVRDVDLADPLPAIPSVDASGRRSMRAWLLVRMYTEPLGTVLVDLPRDGLTATELGSAIERELGPRIRHRAGEVGVRTTGPMGVDGIVPRRSVPYVDQRDRVLADAPHLTVVVCTRNQPVGLRRLLESVQESVYPRYRILVVDNAPTDDRTERVAREAGTRGDVSYVVEPRPGLSHARNRALEETGTDIIAWTDDDAVVDRFWLAEIARAFTEHPEADVMTGPIVPAELETRAQLWFEEFGGHSKGRGFDSFVFSPPYRQDPLYPLPPFGTGANMAWRAGVAESIGGFDPALGAGTPAKGSEDTLAFTQILRAGGTIVYHPGAVIRHYHRRDMEGLRDQMVGYGTGLTAAYASLVRSQPTILLNLAKLAPRALHDLYVGRNSGIGADFPPELLQANRRGMLRGPKAYFEGRRRNAAGSHGTGRWSRGEDDEVMSDRKGTAL